MNKIMNINIGGIIFNVDKETYDRLNSYLKEINNHFKETEGGEEIINDIESRIVELFQQRLNSKKEVITIQDVEEVITIMGKPSDFEGEPQDDYNDPDVRQYSKKRMFRDIDNRMLGGVCSGLGAYFRIDTVWFRIGFVVATLSGLSILAYLILWVIIPPARTVSEKLEMNGDPVTVSNIEKSIREEMDEIRSKIDDLAAQAKRKFRKKS
ncbi:MAG TPA: PspC domain-containing protein [Bacteroidales bacterium]|jgi:phage shock protein PspC (stress-responsive transcriptional regulator)|nr:PspC domain-containing protein [Bacteroidales bacterium]|tara:strand:- start:1665 stop:2294 length:630 start_codon:yes stop_codon:yes gene_type:complete